MTHPHNSADVLERKEQILAPLDPERYTALMRLVAAPQHRIVASFGGGSVPGLCGNLAFGKILEELGIDAHAKWYYVARQLDGATPQPVQKMDFHGLLRFVTARNFLFQL